MNGLANTATFTDYSLGWSTLLAQDTDQDLEFDEGLEEDDFDRHKPPNRRPLLWILVLLIAVGVVYWTMKPDLAILPTLQTNSDSVDVSTQAPNGTEGSSEELAPPVLATPHFGEGDQVTLSLDMTEKGSGMTLTVDAAGIEPGPRVQPKTSLTILDGAPIDQHWVYHVRTVSGEQGWIAEKHLQKKH